MESGLMFCSSEEYDNLNYSCEVLGRYLSEFDAVSNELFNKDFDSYYTFTKEEWESDLEGIIDKETLPDHSEVFDPEEGIQIVDKIKSDILADPEHYRDRFRYYEKTNDYKKVLIDLDKIKELLLTIKKENKKWYIMIIDEM